MGMSKMAPYSLGSIGLWSAHNIWNRVVHNIWNRVPFQHSNGLVRSSTLPSLFLHPNTLTKASAVENREEWSRQQTRRQDQTHRLESGVWSQTLFHSFMSSSLVLRRADTPLSALQFSILQLTGEEVSTKRALSVN